LRTERPLQHRFAEVPDLRETADREPEPERLDPPERREKHELGPERAEQIGDHGSRAALDGLSRTDTWHELVSAEPPSAEIAPDIAGHRDHDGEDHPPPPARLRRRRHRIG